MPIGKHYDETGWLNERDGRLLLRRDEGGEWVLDMGFRLIFRARHLIGRKVRVRGERDGFNVLAVSSLEPVSPV